MGGASSVGGVGWGEAVSTIERAGRRVSRACRMYCTSKVGEIFCRGGGF